MQPQPNAVYNLNTNTYRLFPMRDAAFCAGHSLLKDGTVLIVGGDGAVVDTGYTDGRYLIRVFTGGANPSYVVTAQMSPQPGSNDPNSGARWYPSLSTMVDGNVLIVGGHTTQGDPPQRQLLYIVLLVTTLHETNFQESAPT